MELPDDFHCPSCGTEYHMCPADFYGSCMKRPVEVVQGDWAYNRRNGEWIVEHIPSTTIIGRYPSLWEAQNAVVAGRYSLRYPKAA